MGAKKRQQTCSTGEVFLVPLCDGSYGIGQVSYDARSELGSYLCLYFGIRAMDRSEEAGLLSRVDASHLISAVLTTSDLFDTSVWPVISSIDLIADPYEVLDLRQLEKDRYVGARIIGSGIITSFLEAYFCLIPWDTFYRPDYLDELLISPSVKPMKLRCKLDGNG